MMLFQTADEIQARIDRVRDDLTYRHDGPLTLFVLIARATELVRKGGDKSIIDSALHDCITEGHYVDAPTTSYNTADGY